MNYEFNVELILNHQMDENQVKIIKSKVLGPIICPENTPKSIVSQLLMNGFLETNKVSITFGEDTHLVCTDKGEPILALYSMN